MTSGANTGSPSRPRLRHCRRRQKSAYAGEQLHQVSVKGPVSVMGRFVEYCDRERLPYWQAIEKLMDLAGEER